MHSHAHTILHTPVLVHNKSEGEGGMEGGNGVRGLNMGQSAAALTRVAGCSSYSTSIVADASAGVSVVSTHTGEETWPPSQPAIKCRACKLRRPQDVLGQHFVPSSALGWHSLCRSSRDTRNTPVQSAASSCTHRACAMRLRTYCTTNK